MTIILFQGMAYQSLSSLSAKSPFASLVDGGLFNNMFSMCMPPLLHTDLQGVLTLGADGGHHSDGYQYTSLYRSLKMYYTVYLKSITLAGQNPIDVNPSEYNSGSKGTIVDSGSALIELSDVAFNAVTQAFALWCTLNPTVPGCSSFNTQSPLTGHCYPNINPSDYPSVTFTFNQASPFTYAVLSPSFYFFPCDDESMMIGIVPGALSGDAVLGIAFMSGFEVLFDVGNNRVGYANVSGCSIFPPPPSYTPVPPPTPSPSPIPLPPAILLPMEERNSLEDLYVSTNGLNWLNSQNWMDTTDPCDTLFGWYGVECVFGVNTSHVQNMNLTSNNLNGTLPVSLNSLTALENLHLDQNSLSSTLPSITQMTSLQEIVLSLNSLSGQIPDCFTSLQNLVKLLLDMDFGGVLCWNFT